MLANLGQAVLTRPFAVLAQHWLITTWSGTDGVAFYLVVRKDEWFQNMLACLFTFDIHR